MARKMPTWAKQAASVVTILAAWFVLTIVTFDSVPDAITLKAPVFTQVIVTPFRSAAVHIKNRVATNFIGLQ
jgi:hypothetical protein